MTKVSLEILTVSRKYFYPEPIDITLIPMAGDFLNIIASYYVQKDGELTTHKKVFINSIVLYRIFHFDTTFDPNTIVQIRVKE